MTRKEAIKIVRDLYEKSLFLKKDKEAIETLIPEAKESEDERIRKALIHLINEQDGFLTAINGISVKDIIAYLEKQKEQKPLSTEETELNSLAFLSQMGYTCIPPKKEHQNNSDAPKNALGGALNSPLDKDKNLDDIAQDYVEAVKEYNPDLTWDLMQTAVCYGYNYCKQEEQKPAEWSEDTLDEFTNNIRALITDKLTTKTKGPDGSEMSFSVFIDDKTAKDIANGILFYVGKEAMKNPNREIPEWSEEDKEMLDDIIDYMLPMPLFYASTTGESDKEYTKEFIDKATNWLKSLRPQPKQEDRYMAGYQKGFSDAENVYNNGVSYHIDNPNIHKLDPNVVIHSTTDGTDVACPRWKPSEEQMEWLESAVKLSTDKPHIHGIIISLYEQLKRL